MIVMIGYGRDFYLLSSLASSRHHREARRVCAKLFAMRDGD